MRCVGKRSDESEVSRGACDLLAGQANIHFHVWTQREFIEFVPARFENTSLTACSDGERARRR
ncbi:hypothetical protein BH18VER2_BH18VER2_13220 [soil metagenome]